MKWQEPPEHSNRPGKYQEEAAALRANPGKWALLMEGVPKSYAVNIKRGQLVAFKPAGAYEAVSRKRADGNKTDIYVRYVGEQS